MQCLCGVIVVTFMVLWAAEGISRQDENHVRVLDNRIVPEQLSNEENSASDLSSRAETSASRESSESQEEITYRISDDNKEQRKFRERDIGQYSVQESDMASQSIHNNILNMPPKNKNKTLNEREKDIIDAVNYEHYGATSGGDGSLDVPNRSNIVLREQGHSGSRKSRVGRKKPVGYYQIRKEERAQRKEDRIAARQKGYSSCDERLQFRKIETLPSRKRKAKPSDHDESVHQAGGLDITSEIESLRQGAEQMMEQWMVEAQRRYPGEFEKLRGEWEMVMEAFQLGSNINAMVPKGDNISNTSDNEHPNLRRNNEVSVPELDTTDASYVEHQVNQSRETKERQTYTTVCVSSSGYEARTYGDALWVATTVNTSSYDFAGMIGYKRIFRYIQGENSHGVKIAMTVPLRKIIRNEGGHIDPVSLLRNESFTVYMYLPAEYSDNPPLPLEDEIFIERSSYSAYAFNFSGWAYGLNVYEKYFEYRRILLLHGEPFTEGYFTVQMYDSPWVIDYRHNELLLPVNYEEGSPRCDEIANSPDNRRRCESFQCPVLRDAETVTSNITTRLIDTGMYAVKKSDTCDLQSGLTTVIKSLHHYCHWANSRSVNMGRTVRTLQFGTRLPPDHASNCSYSLETSLHLPQQFHHNAPTPCDDSIIIRRIEQTRYYVLSFHNTEQRPTDQDIQEEYEKTKELLHERGRCFSSDTFIFATCDFRSPRDAALARFELYIPVNTYC